MVRLSKVLTDGVLIDDALTDAALIDREECVQYNG
jgi:hypothetical protein